MTEITWFIKHKRHLSFIMIILFIISILNSNLLSISIHAAYTHHYYYEDYMFHNSDNTEPDDPTPNDKILMFYYTSSVDSTSNSGTTTDKTTIKRYIRNSDYYKITFHLGMFEEIAFEGIKPTEYLNANQTNSLAGGKLNTAQEKWGKNWTQTYHTIDNITYADFYFPKHLDKKASINVYIDDVWIKRINLSNTINELTKENILGYINAASGENFAGSIVKTGIINYSNNYMICSIYLQSTSSISYHANGGTGTMLSSDIAASGGTLRPNTFTRFGYTFAGWATSPNGGVIYSDQSQINPTSDMTLYAVWNINKHDINITETATNGSNNMSQVSYNSSITVHSGSKAGYHFNGWTVSGISDENIISGNFSDSSFTFSMPDNHVSLQANWIPNTYQITTLYTGTDGTTGFSSPYGSTVSINAGTKKGHTFIGWSFPDSSKTASLSNNLAQTSFLVPNNDVIVQANWNKNNYTLTAASLGENGSGNGTYFYGDKVTLKAGTKDGYYFKGWRIETGENELNGLDLNQTNLVFSMPAENVVITAQWTAVRNAVIRVTDKFNATYKISPYYRPELNAFDVSKGISLEKDDIIVVLQTDEGEFITDNYNFVYNGIKYVGINNITIEVVLGKNIIQAILPLNGYSPALKETMDSLGLAETDYEGLAKKVAQMRGEIETLKEQVISYETLIKEIKNKLEEKDITIELTGTLKEDLKSVTDALTKATDRISQLENELTDVYAWIHTVGNILGLDQIVSDYDTFIQVKDQIVDKILQLQTEQQKLLEEYNRLLHALGIDNNLTEGDINNDELFDNIIFKVEGMKTDLDSYKKETENLKELIGVENNGTVTSQMDEIYHKVSSLITSLDDLKTEIERVLASMDSNIDTSGMTTLEAIIKQIEELKAQANNQKNFINSLKSLVELDENASMEELYLTISNMKNQLEQYESHTIQIKQLLELAETEEEKKNLQLKLETIYQEVETLVKEVSLLETVLNELFNRNDIEISDLETLQSLLEQLKQETFSQRDFINSLKELVELPPQSSKEELYTKIEDMKHQLALHTNTISKLKDLLSLAETEEEKQNLQLKLNTIYQEIETLVKEISLLEKVLNELFNRNDIEISDLETLQSLLEQLKQETFSQRDFINSLKELIELPSHSSKEELYTKIEDMKLQLALHTDTISKLKDLLSLAETEEEKQNLQLKLDTLYQEIETFVKEISLLEKVLNELFNRDDIEISDLETLQSLLEQLKQETLSQRDFINSLKELVELPLQSSKEELYTKIEDMKYQLHQYEENITQLKNLMELAETEEEKQNLQLKLENVYQKVDILLKEIDIIENVLKSLLGREDIDIQEISDLEKLLEELKKMKDDLQNKIDSQYNNITRLEKEILLLKELLTKAEENVKELETENINLKNIISSNLQEKNNLLEHNQQLEENIILLKESLIKAEESKEEKNKAFIECQNTLTNYKEKIEKDAEILNHYKEKIEENTEILNHIAEKEKVYLVQTEEFEKYKEKFSELRKENQNLKLSQTVLNENMQKITAEKKVLSEKLNSIKQNIKNPTDTTPEADTTIEAEILNQQMGIFNWVIIILAFLIILFTSLYINKKYRHKKNN